MSLLIPIVTSLVGVNITYSYTSYIGVVICSVIKISTILTACVVDQARYGLLQFPWCMIPMVTCTIILGVLPFNFILASTDTIESYTLSAMISTTFVPPPKPYQLPLSY